MIAKPTKDSSYQAPNGTVIFWRSVQNHCWFFSLLLVAVIFFIYQPAWQGGFLWDDDAHVTKPALRSLDGLAQIWVKPGATQQYYPLVHSVFWVEHQLWGDHTLGYHLTNIVLHAGCALLLLQILRRLEVPGAWLATAIFALHPIQAETVAWITEIKNTLSGALYLGAALVYLNFDQHRKRRDYGCALSLFLFGLMSKTVIATLPAALLVIFWWKRGRLSWKRDVVPLLPFFIAGLASGLFTAWIERKFEGAEGSEFDFSVIERCLIAGRAFWFYLEKLFWPTNLAFTYPRWQISQAVWWQYLFPAAALLLFIGAWLLRRRSRGLLAGLLFFAGTLFPALGFFNVFPFRYSFVADHFQYLAGIGPIALTAAGIAISFRCLTDRNAFIKPAFYGILLALLGMLTWQQARMYVNGETLWRTTLERNPNSWMAYGNLGRELLIRGDENNGLACIEKALEIKPDYLEIHDLLGQVLFGKGRLDEAIEHYKKVLEIRPTDWHGYYNLGFVLIQNGQLDEAIFNFKRALKLQPNEAIIHKTLGEALLQKGQLPDAAVHFKKYLEVQPDSIEVLNNLAWLLATSEDPNVRDGSRAVQLAEHACELTGSKKTTYLGTLAAAYAEAGKFTEAITTAQNACALAGKSGETNLLQKNQELLELYRAHKPYRDAPSPR